MTSPQQDPAQPYTQMDPQAGAYGAQPPAQYGQQYPPQAYQQSAYPQQAYPQQAYPYPQYAYPAAGPAAQTNTMAILSLVFAFVFAPLAIVFGHMARKQIRERGEQGEGLATAGLICGYIFTGIYVVLCAIYVIFAAAIFSAANTVGTGG